MISVVLSLPGSDSTSEIMEQSGDGDLHHDSASSSYMRHQPRKIYVGRRLLQWAPPLYWGTSLQPLRKSG